MKNKILVLFLLCLTILPIFNFVSAFTEFNASDCFTPNEQITSEIPKRPLTLEEWNLSSELLNKAKSNGYISTFSLAVPTGQSLRVSSYKIYILDDVNGKFYCFNEGVGSYNKFVNIKSNCNVICLDYYANYNRNWNWEYNANLRTSDEFNLNAGEMINNDENGFLGSASIYTDDTFTDFFFKAPVQEETLAQVLEKNSPVKNFQTMMSGIIPYLIAFIIGLLAFWKGWQFLSKALRKA